MKKKKKKILVRRKMSKNKDIKRGLKAKILKEVIIARWILMKVRVKVEVEKVKEGKEVYLGRMKLDKTSGLQINSQVIKS